jgi:arsenate reductase (thioredoxin)
MIKVLFVCGQNSARSQIAEAYVNTLCGDDVRAASAGLEPGTLNELAVAAMREDGIDVSLKETKSVFDLYTAKVAQWCADVCPAPLVQMP